MRKFTKKYKLKKKKLEALILYIATKSQNDPTFGMTKLNKILFYSDFSFYYEKEPITGAKYVKGDQGPMTHDLPDALDNLKAENKIAISNIKYYGYTQKKVVPLTNRDVSLFSSEEIAIVDEIIDFFRDKDAKSISEYSHGAICYQQVCLQR